MNALPKGFEPLARAVAEPPSDKLISDLMRHLSQSRAEVVAALEREAAAIELWINGTYQVAKRVLDPTHVHLNIRRRDGRVILRDWRHFQSIKNQLCGPEATAIEVYPAESKLVDTNNKYHLFVFLEPGAVGVEDFFGGKSGGWVGNGENSMSFSDDGERDMEVRAYAEVVRRRTIRRGETSEVEIQAISVHDKATSVTYDSLGLQGQRLNDFTAIWRNMGREDDSPSIFRCSEMPYTEEAAAFFADLLVAMAQLAHRAASFFADEKVLQKAIASRSAVLALPGTTRKRD